MWCGGNWRRKSREFLYGLLGESDILGVVSRANDWLTHSSGGNPLSTTPKIQNTKPGHFKWAEKRTFYGGESDTWWVYVRVVGVADADRDIFNAVQFFTDPQGGVRVSRFSVSKGALAEFQ